MSQTGFDDEGKTQLARSLEIELASVRAKLWSAARTILAPYLVFAGAGARELLGHLLDSRTEDMGHRNSRSGDRERHLLLYLQRVSAKNDTFSEFGPSAWGSSRSGEAVLSFEARPGMARRDVFLERWTAHALAAGINADPETFLERCPRLNPSGILIGHRFVFV